MELNSGTGNNNAMHFSDIEMDAEQRRMHACMQECHDHLLHSSKQEDEGVVSIAFDG